MNQYAHFRNVKIVCTIGPSSNTHERITQLVLAGMNVARLNFSHGNHRDHQKVIKIIRKVSQELKTPVAILQDLQGPKIRVGKFKKGSIQLVENKKFILTTDSVMGTEQKASVSYPSFYKDVREGQSILLDDGLLNLQVEKIVERDVHCRVVIGGILKNNKGLNIPDSILSVETLTEKDWKDLEFGLKADVDYIALSFVQSYLDVVFIKKVIAGKGKRTPVIAKIEKPQAVDDLENIIKHADGAMVARGDLGVEMLPEEVPHIQKQIIQVCNRSGKPVITATQMLESMIYNVRPTRAEASDVANAVLDGTDAVMLSAETASGNYPIETVKTMHNIISITEKKMEASPERNRVNRKELDSVSKAVCHSTCQVAEVVNAKAILCLTLYGTIARTLSKFRPSKPILAISSNQQTIQRLALIWGVFPLPYCDLSGSLEEAIEELNDLLKSNQIAKPKDNIVLTTRIPFRERGLTNSFQVLEVK